MKRPWLMRGAAFGTGAMLTMGALVSTSAEETSAGWNSSQVASATMHALTVQVPANAKCTSSNPPVTGPLATVSWSPASSVNNSLVSYEIVGKQRLSDPEWTFIVEPTTNTYEFKSGLLDGLLKSILTPLLGSGSEFYVGIIAVHSFQGVSWESAVAPTGKIATTQGGALKLISGFQCLN